MMKFTVKSTALADRSIPSKKEGRGPFQFQEQETWADINGEYRRVKFRVKDGRPYPVGEYTLAESSFQVNQYGTLELGFDVELVPIAKVAQRVG